MTTLSFHQFVVDEVVRHWQAKNEPLLLSKLGQAASSRGFALHTELGGLKLSQFIHHYLDDEIEVSSPNASGLLLGALPKQPVAVETAAIAERPSVPPATFNRAMQAAFERPLADQMERWIRTVPTVHYMDIPPSESAPAAYTKLESRYLSRAEDGGTGSDFYERIKLWIHDQGLDINDFTHKPTSNTEGGPSLLTQLMESLTESELKRISLPLDIVAKLMRK
ncbi:hypothetical protein [Pseudomonas sp. HY13-MNA-CIBAN-0226]|uniref:hypothetical protein n=1 Tax=Pseudomonas sp. HY13-MNA-CIBAN-0226 TaxID=3140473 RepID=UPI003325B972